MGTGNIGRTLRFEPDQTNTYISRDGGLSWLEAHKGAFIYEFGDHGGLILMADDLKKTVQVVFTWNEGQSWYDFDVSKIPFEVDNIITEPNVTSTTFLMFGTRQEGEGVLYHMRFDALKFPTCRGVWAADSVSSDYETWTPSDGINTDKCMLGRQITYTRRKKTSQCFNGEKFERPVERKKCSCTQEDYACEIGFMRAIGSTECTFGGADMMPASMAPAVCSSQYLVPAYRKVPGDQCEAGFQPGQVGVPCPNSGISGGLISKVLGVIAILTVIFFCFCRSPQAKPAPSFSAEAAKGRCPLTPSSVVETLRSLPGMFFGPGRGFESFRGVGYQKVGQNPEYDLDGIGGNDVMLSDFIDEAEHDDYAPRLHEKEPPQLLSEPPEDDRKVSGGLNQASEVVPKLQAPPGTQQPGPAQIFDMHGKDDEEDLL